MKRNQALPLTLAVIMIIVPLFNILSSLGTPEFSTTEQPAASNSAKQMNEVPTTKAKRITPSEPVSSILPRRLITVFGTEKSGSTLTATTLAKAAGLPQNIVHFVARNQDETIEVQHMSQPWGAPPGGLQTVCSPENAKRTKDIFALVPMKCARQSIWGNKDPLLPDECKEALGLDEFFEFPSRFFVNVTSHIEWYLNHGVDATAVIMMRDKTISHISKVNAVCKSNKATTNQNEHANEFAREALRRLPAGRVVMVSFEGIISLQKEYLFDIYKKLGINSTYTPEIKDGNARYIRTDLLPPKLWD
jgi:hypothetical protein